MSNMTFSNAFALLDEDAPRTAPAKKEKQPKAAAPAPKVEAAPVKQERAPRGDRGDRGEGNRGGRGRGRRDDRRPAREGKRDFDRSENGTGRDRGAKKAGSGRGNWGSDDAEMKEGARKRREAKEAEAAAAAAAEAEAAAAAEAVPEVVEEEEEEEPEPEVQTYDEYLAARATVADDERIKVREVDNDDSNWKSCGVKSNDVDESDTYAILGGGKKNKKKGGKKKAGVISLDEFSAKTPAAPKAYSSEPRGRGERGRGGPRGGRGGRGGRGRGPRGGNVDLSDSSAFPTLGGK